jgi:hypothetical protein
MIVLGDNDIYIFVPLTRSQWQKIQTTAQEVSATSGDNIYRWQVEVKDGIGTILLPDYYKHLNENDQVWVSPEEHFGRAYGKVTQDQEYLVVKADQDGLYNVLLIGTRKDVDAKNSWKGAERPRTFD